MLNNSNGAQAGVTAWLKKQGWFGDFALTVIEQGRHRSFKLSFNNETLFVKHKNTADIRYELFGLMLTQTNNRQFVDYCSQSQLIFSTWIEGEAVNRLDNDKLEQLVDSLVDIHQNFTNLANFKQDLTGLAKGALSEVKRSNDYVTLCHGDVSSGNVLFSTSRCVFVDWEFSAIRDCRWDLATIISEFGLNKEQTNKLVKLYCAKRSFNQADFTQGVLPWLKCYLNTTIAWARANQHDETKYQTQLAHINSTNCY